MKDSTPSYVECFISLAIGMTPFSLLLAVSAMFGANTVSSGGQNVHGISALIVCIVLNLIFPALFAGLQKLGYTILSLIRGKKSAAVD